MTETRKGYLVSGQPQGPREETLLEFDDPDFEQPTWEEVRAVMRRFSLTGSQVSRLTGVNSRGVRKWTSPPDTSSHAPIPYAAWRLLLIATGLVEPPRVP